MGRLEKLPVEIVDEICTSIDAPSFRHLRLVCRELAAKSHDAFIRQHVRVVHVNVDECGLQHLVDLSSWQNLAPLVQTLHLYPSTLDERCDRKLFTARFMSTPQGSRFRTTDHARAYLYRYGSKNMATSAKAMHEAMVARQERFLDRPDAALIMLARAIRQLPNITTLTVGSQERTERLHGSSGQVIMGGRHSFSKTNTKQALAIVLEVLSHLAIRDLRIGRPMDSIDTTVLQGNKKTKWALMAIQNSVQTLTVCLGPPKHDFDSEALSGFLSKAAKLENLTLIGHYDMYPVSPAMSSSTTMSMLKRLDLEKCFVDPGVFRRFVARHQETVRSIELRSVIMWTKEWHDVLDFLTSDDMELDSLVLEHIRACRSSGEFGCLVFEHAGRRGCSFCGQRHDDTAEPCRHVRVSAYNRDDFIQMRQKLLQSECRIF